MFYFGSGSESTQRACVFVWHSDDSLKLNCVSDSETLRCRESASSIKVDGSDGLSLLF